MARIPLKRAGPATRPQPSSQGQDPGAGLPDDLMDTLRSACFDAIDGPASHLMASRVQRDCLTILRRNHHGNVGVRVTPKGQTLHVLLLVPTQGARVRQVVLTLE